MPVPRMELINYQSGMLKTPSYKHYFLSVVLISLVEFISLKQMHIKLLSNYFVTDGRLGILTAN